MGGGGGGGSSGKMKTIKWARSGIIPLGLPIDATGYVLKT